MIQYEGTFEDYLGMFIQFGYVVLFSSAFPLAALCALVNNLVKIRSDAFKLCAIFQRPFGEPAENIGSWQVRKQDSRGTCSYASYPTICTSFICQNYLSYDIQLWRTIFHRV